jgi:hypothetical protein
VPVNPSSNLAPDVHATKNKLLEISKFALVLYLDHYAEHVLRLDEGLSKTIGPGNKNDHAADVSV